jgi:hypothetical protein
MPTICPNCLRPLRTDVKFCGFCGTDLVPAGETTSLETQAETDETVTELEPAAKEQSVHKPRDVRRMVLIITVILLCLVLLVAFMYHFWGSISPAIHQLLPF